MATTPQLEFYFFLGSTYSHLSVHRAAALAAAGGVELLWRPFSVRTLMREQQNSPFVGKPAKLAYMWRDIERRAARFSVPFNGVAPYPIDAEQLANHMATLASMEGWCTEFTQAAYRLWFIDKQDPGEPKVLQGLLRSLGRDAQACLTRADGAEVRELYLARTQRARELGLFGSPSFVCGSEVFWGDDRLEDAIAWCQAHGR